MYHRIYELGLARVRGVGSVSHSGSIEIQDLEVVYEPPRINSRGRNPEERPATPPPRCKARM